MKDLTAFSVLVSSQGQVYLVQGVADRVSLGLLPSSEGGWQVALSALRPGGGWLHLHQNVTDFQEQEWCQATMVKLQSLAEQQGRLWHFRYSFCHLWCWLSFA